MSTGSLAWTQDPPWASYSDWVGPATGDWNVRENWTTHVPSSPASIARFATSTSAPLSIRRVHTGYADLFALDVSGVSSGVVIHGSSAQFWGDATYPARICVRDTDLELQASVSFRADAFLDVAAGSTLTFNSVSKSLAQGWTVTKTGEGFARGAIKFGGLRVEAGTWCADPLRSTSTANFTLADDAVYDLGSGGLMSFNFGNSVDAYAGAVDYVNRGRLTSHLLDTDARLAIGIAPSSAINRGVLLDEQLVTGKQNLLVTLKGDVNLDRTVDFGDLLQLAYAYGQPAGRRWHNGDSDFDGDTDFADLLALARSYGLSVDAVGQILAAPSGVYAANVVSDLTSALADDRADSIAADFTADWALAVSLVPEPATLYSGLAVALVASTRMRSGRAATRRCFV